MTDDELYALGDQALASWNERDFDRFYALFQPDVRYHGSGSVDLTGVGALRAHYEKALAWCPDLAISRTLAVVDAARGCCASVQVERGTAVDGTPFGFEGMTFFRFGTDRLIAEVWEKIELLHAP